MDVSNLDDLYILIGEDLDSSMESLQPIPNPESLITKPLAGIKCILHQTCNRHDTHTAGYGGYV